MIADLRENARAEILEHVFSGRLLPGERLVERSLAQKLGVSRIPLREALAQLVAQGVLVKEKEGGSVRVRMHSAEDARQVFELREAIEVGAVRAACHRASESDLIRMEVICEQMATQVENYGSVIWAGLDNAFHEAIVAASHNDRFIRNFNLLISETHALFYRHPAQTLRPNVDKEWAVQHMRSVVNAHLAIVGIIRSGDPDRAETAVREHIQTAGAYTIRALLEYELNQSHKPAPRLVEQTNLRSRRKTQGA
jgi:DNA-binding GntR family transcriptional regulator